MLYRALSHLSINDMSSFPGTFLCVLRLYIYEGLVAGVMTCVKKKNGPGKSGVSIGIVPGV